MAITTDPGIRQAFITGLRDLASYLASHPAVPVPGNGAEIYLPAYLTEHGGRAQVDQFAGQTGVTVTDNTAHDGHYEASRFFGPVRYRMIALSHARMTFYQAEAAYNHLDDPWT
jgi:hypothetical protein